MNGLLEKLAPYFGYLWELESSYSSLAKILVSESPINSESTNIDLIRVATFILGVFDESHNDLRGLSFMAKPLDLMVSKLVNKGYISNEEHEALVLDIDRFFSLLDSHPKSRLMSRRPHQQDNVLKYFHYHASGLAVRNAAFPIPQYDKLALPIHTRLRDRINKQQSMSTLRGHELAARRVVQFVPSRYVTSIEGDPPTIPLECIKAAFQAVDQGVIPGYEPDYSRPLDKDFSTQVNRVIVLLASNPTIVRRRRIPGECPDGINLPENGHLYDRQTYRITATPKIDALGDPYGDLEEIEDGTPWYPMEHLLMDAEDDPAPGLLCLNEPENLEVSSNIGWQKPTLPRGFIHTHDVAGYAFSWAGSPWGVTDLAQTFQLLARLAADSTVDDESQKMRAYADTALALALLFGLSSEELLGLRFGLPPLVQVPCAWLFQGHLVMRLPNRLFNSSHQADPDRMHSVADHFDLVVPPFAANRLLPLIAQAKPGQLIFRDPLHPRTRLRREDLEAFLHERCNPTLACSSKDSAAIKRSRPTIPRFRMAGMRLLTHQFGLDPLTWAHVAGTYLPLVGAKRYYLHVGVDALQADHYRACLWMGSAIKHEMNRPGATSETDPDQTDYGYQDLRPGQSDIPSQGRANYVPGLPRPKARAGMGSRRYYHDHVLREHLEGLYKTIDSARSRRDVITFHNAYTMLSCRIAELAALLRPTNDSPQLTDLIEAIPALCVRDKQSAQFHEERLVSLAEPAANFLRDLKLQRKQLLATVAGRHNLRLAFLEVPQNLFLLFGSPDGYPTWDRRLLRQVMTQLGLPQADIFPNAFRHWVSTALMEEGMEHALGDYLRGHSSFGQEAFNPYSAFNFCQEAHSAAQAVMEIASRRLGLRYVPYLA